MRDARGPSRRESATRDRSGSPVARHLLHSVHTVTFLLLLASGLLLFVPELRSLATGGYSLHLRQLHRWSGIAFVALPAAILAGYGARALAARAASRTARARWKRFHFAASAVMTALFAITGAMLWSPAAFSEMTVDLARALHERLTFVAAAFLGAHVIEAGSGAVAQRLFPLARTDRENLSERQDDKEARHGM
jgi:cytochrome b subunit of formate dehydrogenase